MDDVLGLAVEAGGAGHQLVHSMHAAIRALSLSGSNVIADHVLVEPSWVRECAEMLADLPAGKRLRVEIKDPLLRREEREGRREEL